MAAKAKSHKKLFAVLFLALVVFTAVFPLQAFAAAETEHYATWKEAQPAYFPDSDKTNMNEVAYAIEKVVAAGRQNLADGNTDAAYKCAQDAYYGYYEVCGFERQTMARISGSRKNEVEFYYRDLRQAAKSNSVEDYDKAAKGLMTDLYTDAPLLNDISEAFVKKYTEDKEFADNYTSITGVKLADDKVTSGKGGAGSAGAVFAQAFVILLREGIEAILVIGGIIAYLIKSGNRKQVRAVYIGSVLAIALSFGAAILLNAIKAANATNGGANQEIIEGVTALIAVAVLFYVSNWMLSKSESEAWQKYLDKKVESSVSKGSMIALGFTAFLAVFREGAEVILFYQQIITDAQEGDGVGWLWLGVVAAAVVLIVIFIAIRFFSVKLPLKPFFLATSILMAVMAISFLGAGIKELMEGSFELVLRIQGVTPLVEQIPTNDFLDIFGIYPHTETVVPQVILLGITIALFIRQHFENKRIKEELKTKAELKELKS
ncbi:MAG: FTR1 family protein [Ruminococcus sp.]|nr:FTR1 family protein [Ruminococcus sp.]